MFTRVTMSEAFSMDEDAAAEAWNEEAALGAFFEQVAGGAAASGAPATAGASAPFPSSEIPRGGGTAHASARPGHGRAAYVARQTVRAPRWDTVNTILSVLGGLAPLKGRDEIRDEHYVKALELCLNDENGPYNINRGKDKKITMSLKAYVEQMRAQKERKDLFGHGIPMQAPSAASTGGGGPATTRNPLVDIILSQKSKDHLRQDDQAMAQFSNTPMGQAFGACFVSLTSPRFARALLAMRYPSPCRPLTGVSFYISLIRIRADARAVCQPELRRRVRGEQCHGLSEHAPGRHGVCAAAEPL